MPSKKTDITALLLSMTVPSLAAYAYFVLLADSPAAPIIYALSRVFLLAFPAAWFLLLERGRPAWPHWNTTGVILGLAFALVVGAAAWAAYQFVLTGRLDLSGVQSKAEEFNLRDHYLLFAAFLCVANSVAEEYYWRWFVFGRCRRLWGLAPAAAASGLAFAAHHSIVLTIMLGLTAGLGLSLAVAAGGIVWACLYDRYRSLYACWFSHLLVDVVVLSIGRRMLSGLG